MNAGKEEMQEGLSSDTYDVRHRMFLPEQFVKQLLKEARTRKRAKSMVEKGKLVPLSKFSESIGLKARSLHSKTGLKKIRIGNSLFVRPSEAKRFKAEYFGKKAGKKSSKAVKKKFVKTAVHSRTFKKAVKKKPGLVSARPKVVKRKPRAVREKPVQKAVRPGAGKSAKKRAVVAPAEKFVFSETIKIGIRWMKEHARHAGSSQKALMNRVIDQYSYLSPQEFREQVFPILEKLL